MGEKRKRKKNTSPEGILYWIHSIHDGDIYTQGYVGITVLGLHHRFKQHLALAKKGEYPKRFRDGLLSNTLLAETYLVGSIEYIREMERHFRPSLNIGWNRAIGGDGGNVFKHGLTGTPINSRYYNMLKKAEVQGCSISEEWLGEDGIAQFAEDMLPIPKGGKISRKDNSLGYSKDNCIYKTQTEICRETEWVGNVIWEGKSYTYLELANLAGESPNTLQYRLYRGWTMEEALNIKPRKKRFIKDFNGDLVRYDGQFTDEEILEIVDLRLAGETNTSIGDCFDVNNSQISRLCTRLKVTK